MTSRSLCHLFPAEGAVAAQMYPGGARLVVLIETSDDPLRGGGLVFDLSGGGPPVRAPLIGEGPRFAVFPADESFLFAGGLNQCVSFYYLRAGVISNSNSSLQGHAATIHNAVLSPDEKMFATASEDETVRLWDRATKTELLVLRGDPSPMLDVAFGPTGDFLAAAQGNGTVRVWDGRPKPGSVSSRRE